MSSQLKHGHALHNFIVYLDEDGCNHAGLGRLHLDCSLACERMNGRTCMTVTGWQRAIRAEMGQAAVGYLSR